MNATSTIRLDRDALDDNLLLIKRLAGPGRAVCGVVKADAYGIGASRIVPRMVEQNLDMLAVYSLSEAAELAPFSGRLPILVLMGVRQLDRSASIRSLVAHNRLQLVVHDLGQLSALEREAATFGSVLRLHVELDSGMGRGGCDVEEAGEMLDRIATNPRLELHGIMTHLPDPMGDVDGARRQREQLERFVRFKRDVIPAEARLHAAATMALGDPSLRLDMLRVGLAWTGLLDPQAFRGSSEVEYESFKPVLSLWSHLVQVRRVPKGHRVGYGSLWRAPRESIVGLAPVGYAQGLPEARPGHRHRVVVHGADGPTEAPVLGAVNMDQISIDLTDCALREPGAAVEVISSERTSPAFLLRVAARAGLSPYALLTGLDPRIPRVMVAGHEARATLDQAVPREVQRSTFSLR